MHTEKREDPLVELGYEVRDLNTVAIRNATIGFFIFTIASAVIGFGVYRVMNPTVFHPQPPTNRVIAPSPYPMVQTNMGAKTDIMDIRQHETSVLTAPVGWADDQKTHLHVPIDRAMELVVSKGLKPTGESVPAVSKGHTPDPAIGEKAAPATITPAITSGAVKVPALSSTLGAPVVPSTVTAPTSKKPN